MKILIIEDEPFAQAELIRLLKQTGRDFTVLAKLDTVEESINWFADNPAPDLVFLDIQLADGLSFDIFRQLKMDAPVIFTTAYDEFAIKAFQLNSIDYLLKPIKPDDLDKALEKMDRIQDSFAPATLKLDENQIRNLLKIGGEKEFKSRFLVKLGDELKSIAVADIAYFYAEDNLVFLKSTANKRFIIDHTLEQLEPMIDPQKFFRISRSFIVMINAVGKVSKYFNSRLVLELDPPADEKVLVSRHRVPGFIAWLDR